MKMGPHTSEVNAESKNSNHAIIKLHPVSLVGDCCSENGLVYCYLNVSPKIRLQQ